MWRAEELVAIPFRCIVARWRAAPNKAVEPTAPMVAVWHAGVVHGAAAHRGRSAPEMEER